MIYFLSHPIQYFSPLFRELSKKTDLKVYFFSDASIIGKKDIGFGQNIKWDIPLLDGYKCEFVKNYSRHISLQNKFFDVFNPGVVKILKNSSSKIIIVNGWTYSSTLMCIFFGRLFGKKIWLRAENPLNQELKKRKIILLLKKIFLKHLLFRYFVDKCLYIGTENKKFFEFYGVAASKQIYTPYAVDNNYFSNEYARLKKDIITIKSDLGLLPEKKIILFSGKYIAKKRPLDLLQAFKLLNDPSYSLIMVGEGELRNKMEDFIRENKLENILLTGFINQSEISKYYAIANVFVMCSGTGETWGLSVNEIMNFEKPILVSKTSGCSFDLVKEGVNGFTFEEGNVDDMAYYLKKVLSDNDFQAMAGKKSLNIIQDYCIENITLNLVEGIEK